MKTTTTKLFAVYIFQCIYSIHLKCDGDKNEWNSMRTRAEKKKIARKRRRQKKMEEKHFVHFRSKSKKEAGDRRCSQKIDYCFPLSVPFCNGMFFVPFLILLHRNTCHFAYTRNHGIGFHLFFFSFFSAYNVEMRIKKTANWASPRSAYYIYLLTDLPVCVHECLHKKLIDDETLLFSECYFHIHLLSIYINIWWMRTHKQ